jgi:hypothetical protein
MYAQAYTIVKQILQIDIQTVRMLPLKIMTTRRNRE